jgi:hypothetical protein
MVAKDVAADVPAGYDEHMALTLTLTVRTSTTVRFTSSRNLGALDYTQCPPANINPTTATS